MTTARRGFTLLETAIVLAITAIGALLVLPVWPSAFVDLPETVETPGAALADALGHARRHAIAAQHTVLVRLDAPQRRMRMDTAGVAGRGVWRDTILPLAPDELLLTADTITVVVFRPSGAAFGRPMALRHSTGWVSLSVDPWSGEVHRVAR